MMNFNFAEIKEKISNYFAVKSFRDTREVFYEDLADAVKDGELLSAFIGIRKARAVKQKDPLAPLYSKWLIRMNKKGGRLSHILNGSAPESDLMVISSIEDKGNLSEGLKFIASTIKDQRGMSRAIKGAIFMPAIVSIVMIAFMVILSVFVIPVFAQIAPPEKWAGIGKAMYIISYSVTHFGIFLLAGVVAAICWFSWSLNNWVGPRREFLDQYLPYSVYRDYTGSIFMVSLASMLHSGDTLVRALEQLKKTAPLWLKWQINKILKNINGTSRNYGEAFAVGVFSRSLTNRLIDLSRRSSEFDKVIARIGIEGIVKVRTAVEESAKKLNVVLIAVLGCCLAFMLVGTLLTAQGLSASLKEQVNNQQVK
jgi:toxin coregulated pilus biosynthesis protein E